MTAGADLDGGAGHGPVEVHHTDGDVVVLVAAVLVNVAPLVAVVQLELHEGGEVFGSGHGQAKAHTMQVVFGVLVIEALHSGEGGAVTGVELDVNSVSGSGSGHDHAGGGEKSNELLHDVIPLK